MGEAHGQSPWAERMQSAWAERAWAERMGRVQAEHMGRVQAEHALCSAWLPMLSAGGRVGERKRLLKLQNNNNACALSGRCGVAIVG